MPFKIGGGFKLEAYDPDNGQYTEEDKIKMREYDDFWFKQALTMHYEPHIPTKGIHSDEYAYKYVERFKSYLYNENNPPHINDSKMYFLFDGKIKPKRTQWLKNIGFSLPNVNDLTSEENKKYIENFQKYLRKNTDFTSIYFVKFLPDGTMSCNAITNIEGHKVTTGWKINSNFQLEFVTLIETSKTYYAKKNKIRR